ncbi:MAG: GDP-mannose 4,6-dehydratase [Acidimicrobiales bacterium]
MHALVTGATGFVGRHLVEHLVGAGDEVVGIDRAAGHVDIRDREGVAAAIEDARPETVYHLAGWSDVGASWSSPVETFQVNAQGTLNVLLACADAGVRRVVAVSSADVYGAVTEDELPIGEDAPLRPVSPYAASKVAADYLGLQAWLGRKLEVVRVRAFNHLGPGQSQPFVAAALAARIAEAELSESEVVRVGDLSARRDFTDVRDVVRAYRLLALLGEPGAAYNVCSGRDVAVSEVAEQLLALADRPLRLEVDPALLRPVDVPVMRGDNRRLRAATGWTPSIKLPETLAVVLADWRARVRARDGHAEETR